MFYDTNYVLESLEKSIAEKKPFSHIRLGDVCNLFLAMWLAEEQYLKHAKAEPYFKWKDYILKSRFKIAPERLIKFCKGVVTYSNQADFIDALVVDKEFQPPDEIVRRKLLDDVYNNWKLIHKLVGIENKNYCSYISHYTALIRGRKNLIQIMKNKKVFFINGHANIVKNHFRKYCSTTGYFNVFGTPDRQLNTGQYENVLKLIKNQAKNFDLFIVGAGMPGKIYCGYIKKCGGRAFDLGSIFEYWRGKQTWMALPLRHKFLNTESHLLYELR